MQPVAVIGGGIAGLVAALELQRHGIPMMLLEADGRLGGKIWTTHADDLLVEAGPDSFLSTKPAALGLVESLGLSHRVINTRVDGGGTYILHKRKLQPLPEGLTLLVPAEFKAIARTPLLSPIGKLRMAADYLLPPKRGEDDESVAAFVRRRVGREAFEHLAEPLLSGIYAGDAERLSLQATFPRFRETEQQHGGMIKGAIAQRRQSRATGNGRRPGHTPFVSLQGGLGELVDAIHEQLDRTRVHLNEGALALHETAEGFVVETACDRYSVAGAVVAVPGPIASRILASLDCSLSDELAGIEYVSSATISLAFRAEEVTSARSGRGFVIPRREGRQLTAVTWTSNKFPGRAPEGVTLLRGFVGRAGQQEILSRADDTLIRLVRQELQEILGLTAEPIFSEVFRWQDAIPQYNLGHPERLERIEHHLGRHPAIALTGAAFRGVGIPDCIRDSQEQTRGLIARLAGRYAA